MPAHAAISGKLVTFPEGTAVEDALAALDAAEQAAGAVVDSAGKTVGVFGYFSAIKTILPVSVSMPDGSRVNLHVSAAPGIALRLKKILPLSVTEVMERKFQSIAPDAGLSEVAFALTHSPEPLLVMDPETRHPLGFVAPHSVFKELNRLKDS